MCWQVRAAATWQLLAALLLLVPCFNFFGGMALLHGYLAASAQTSYEICKGAKARPCTANLKPPSHASWHAACLCNTSHRLAEILTERPMIATLYDKQPWHCHQHLSVMV